MRVERVASWLDWETLFVLQGLVRFGINRDGNRVEEDPYTEVIVMAALGAPPPPGGHPNVLRVYGAGEDADRAYVVMELAQGRDLLDRIQSRALTEPELRAAMRDVLRGVAHMHARDIAHLDLSLENVLVGAPAGIGDVKIMDFGLTVRLVRDAAGAVQLSGGGMAVGKKMYFSPEVRVGVPRRRAAHERGLTPKHRCLG